MKTSRKTAVLVGALFLIATASFFLGDDGLVAPILGAEDYLVTVSENQSQVILGVLIAFIDGLAIVGISVLLLPLLKRYGEAMALGYVGFRITEFAVILAYLIGGLMLITLSHEYVSAADHDATTFQSLGALLRGLRYWSWQFILLFNGVAGLMVTYLFYRSRLIPRPISILGIIGYAILFPGVLLHLFGVVDILSGIGFLVFIPGAIFEAGLPIWLFVKGFNQATPDATHTLESVGT
ncbi:DUF4386 domain-containing protein [Candidatus Bipolaricaulota bacterium]